jgi:hypothetical protein
MKRRCDETAVSERSDVIKDTEGVKYPIMGT